MANMCRGAPWQKTHQGVLRHLLRDEPNWLQKNLSALADTETVRKFEIQPNIENQGWKTHIIVFVPVIKTLFFLVQTVEMPLTTEPDPFLDGYQVRNWTDGARGAETFDMERNPPGTRRHRVSAPQKQLQSVPACREHLSDERDFSPRAKNPTVLNAWDPYYLRCSPYLSDSHRDFVLLKISHYDLMKKAKKKKSQIDSRLNLMSGSVCRSSHAYSLVCMALQSCVCVCARARRLESDRFPAMCCSWIQLFGLFNIAVYITDGRQSLDDKRGNMCGNVTAAWKVYAAAVRLHNVRIWSEEKKKKSLKIVF